MTKHHRRLLSIGETIQAAITREQPVRFTYRGVDRAVLPVAWGQALDGGFYFRGPQLFRGDGDPTTLSAGTRGRACDQAGNAIRTFRLDSVEGDVSLLDLGEKNA